MWLCLSVTCSRSVVFFWYTGFLHLYIADILLKVAFYTITLTIYLVLTTYTITKRRLFSMSWQVCMMTICLLCNRSTLIVLVFFIVLSHWYKSLQVVIRTHNSAQEAICLYSSSLHSTHTHYPHSEATFFSLTA